MRKYYFLSTDARRYIVLDFGQPVRLTDVVIPACADITSLAIDVWLERELVDSQRLVVCTDISTKCLMLTDIQPACVCQYLKVSLTNCFIYLSMDTELFEHATCFLCNHLRIILYFFPTARLGEIELSPLLLVMNQCCL